MSTTSLVVSAPAEQELVARGRAAFAVTFPGQEFESDEWSMKHLKRAGASAGNVRLHYSRVAKGRGGELLPPRFSAIVKAIIAIHASATGTMSYYEYASRWMWEGVLDRRGGDSKSFSWQGLRAADAERAEHLMLDAGLASSTVYKTCTYINSVMEKLAAEGVISPKHPVFKTPRYESHSRHTLAGQDERLALLPSEEAIEAVLALYQGEYELTDFERLVICAVTIMFATGVRIQELLELRDDALIYEGGSAYLLFNKAKSPDVEDRMALSARQAALVAEAMGRARQLTRAARAQASVLDAFPCIVPLPPEYANQRLFGIDEVGAVLGREIVSGSQLRKVLGIQASATSDKVSRSQLQDCLQRIREKRCPESITGLAHMGASTPVPLTRALFVMFLNGAHSKKADWRNLVHLMRYEHAHDILVGRKGTVESVFARHGLLERDGQPITINPHAFRHNVSTHGSASGIADSFLARWQRRTHEADLQSYIHLTRAEQVARLRAAVRDGHLQGEVPTMYWALAPEERDMFLDGVVQAVHVTPLGLCVHDFNTAPCPLSMNCVRRCGSFLWDPNDEAERATLVQLRRRDARALEDAKRAVEEGTGILAEQWVKDHEETIACLDEILSVPRREVPEKVRVFSGAPSHYKPVS